MLVDFLSQHPEIARDVATHTVSLDPPTVSREARRKRLGALLDELSAALRLGVVEHELLDGDGELRERELLRHEILEKLEHLHLGAPVRELAILSDWVWGGEHARLGEANLQKAELLDLCPDAAAIVALDGRVRYVNRAAAQIFHALTGLPGEHVIGKPPRELGFLLDAGPSTLAEFEALARSSSVAEVLVMGRWREIRVKEIHALDGSVHALGFSLTDIHDRKIGLVRLELLSKLSRLVGAPIREDLWTALAQVPIPQLADWCAVSVIEDAEIDATFIAQCDPSKGRLRDSLLHVAAGLKHHPLWRSLLATGLQLLSDVSDELLRSLLDDAEYRLLSQVGIRSLLVVPVVTRGRPIAIITLAYTGESGRRYGPDDPGVALELALHAAHIAENARLVEEVRASDARFRIALAEARTIVYEQDEALRYTWCYGHDPASPVEGKTHAEVWSPTEAQALTQLKQQVLDFGAPVTTEIELVVDGERRIYRETIEAVRDQLGRRTGVIGAATDLTAEKRTQQALQDAVEVRDRLMAILGHDLRNPLTTMSMAATMLLERDDLSAETGRVVRMIERAARRMTEMIDTLVDFTRIRVAGMLPVVRTPCDFAEIAREIIDESRLAWPERVIELEVRGRTHDQCDPPRIAQALSNVLANAIRYGDATRPIRVAIDGEADELRVAIHNEGPPIPEWLVPVLFEPFARGQPDVVSPHGLGLGLFVVKEIITSHGGTVEVLSTREHGTTFTFRIPRAG